MGERPNIEDFYGIKEAEQLHIENTWTIAKKVLQCMLWPSLKHTSA